MKTHDEIRAGNLSVRHSKRFGHLDDFFIPEEQWETARDRFFARSVPRSRPDQRLRQRHGTGMAAVSRCHRSARRRSRRPRAVLAVPRPREQPARQTLEQGDRRIGQRRFQLPHLCGQRSEPPPLAEVAEQVDRSDRSLACELGSSGRVDVVAEMAR